MVQLIRNFNPKQQHPTLGYLAKLALVDAASGSFLLEELIDKIELPFN